MSKIFNIVCFKPIEFKYSYNVKKYEDDKFGVMPFIIKQGRDNSLYLVDSQKINSLQEGIEQYYNSRSNRTEKIPFIYIKQSENETTKVDIDGKQKRSHDYGQQQGTCSRSKEGTGAVQDGGRQRGGCHSEPGLQRRPDFPSGRLYWRTDGQEDDPVLRDQLAG